MTYVRKVYLEIDEVLLLKSVMLLLHFQVISPRDERGNESERGGKQTFCFVRLCSYLFPRAKHRARVWTCSAHNLATLRFVQNSTPSWRLSLNIRWAIVWWKLFFDFVANAELISLTLCFAIPFVRPKIMVNNFYDLQDDRQYGRYVSSIASSRKDGCSFLLGNSYAETRQSVVELFLSNLSLMSAIC